MSRHEVSRELERTLDQAERFVRLRLRRHPSLYSQGHMSSAPENAIVREQSGHIGSLKLRSKKAEVEEQGTKPFSASRFSKMIRHPAPGVIIRQTTRIAPGIQQGRVKPCRVDPFRELAPKVGSHHVVQADAPSGQVEAQQQRQPVQLLAKLLHFDPAQSSSLAPQPFERRKRNSDVLGEDGQLLI